MSSSRYDTAQEYADTAGTDAPRDPNEPGTFLERGNNWIGMGVVGILLIIMGFIMVPSSDTVGGGVVFIGVLMMLGSGVAYRWEQDPEIVEDMDYQVKEAVDAQKTAFEIEDILRTRESAVQNEFDAAREIEQGLRMRDLTRQQEIEEIIKAVKKTIRVRCRYCGTLNEEKANNCTSCGGSL
jgi:hypothetical protein